MNPTVESNGLPRGVDGIEVVVAYEAVARGLRRAIHLGELPPGSKLPAERVLASQLNVSRITLREAIRKLEGEGYVTVERGSRGGAFVRSDEMPPAEVRSWIRARRGELEAIFDFRMANERSAAERAAVRVGATELKELRTIIDDSKSSDDIGALRASDVRFHMRIAELADSEMTWQAVGEARAALYVPFRAISLKKIQSRTVPDHNRIVDALESGDPKKAARAVEHHLKASAGQIRALAGLPAS